MKEFNKNCTYFNWTGKKYVCIEKEHFQSFLIFNSVILILTHADPIRVEISPCDIGVTWSRIRSSTERMWLLCQTPVGTGVILSASGLSSMQVVSVHELLQRTAKISYSFSSSSLGIPH